VQLTEILNLKNNGSKKFEYYGNFLKENSFEFPNSNSKHPEILKAQFKA
jgi:hypothetical protein